jgi:hypothetical protein
MAVRATHVHCPGEQMHDDVAAAQDRYRQSNIDKSFFQGELSDGRTPRACFVVQAALLDRSSRTGFFPVCDR